MKEKRNIKLSVELTCTDKASCEKLEEMLASLPGVNKIIVTETDTKEKKDLPKAGEIWTYLNEEGDPEEIFCANGEIFKDEDLIVYYESERSVGLSGDILKPYIVTIGESMSFYEKNCRKATVEEIALYNEKMKRAVEEEGKEAEFTVGEWVYVVGCEPGGTDVFYTVPVTYAETRTMENISNRGWMFKNEMDCKILCDRLNEAIKDVKL